MAQALLQFVQHDELASEFVLRSSRERLRCGVSSIDDNIHLKPGTIVEVIGAHGTGKTEILLQAAVNSLVTSLDGPGSHAADVVYLDLDGKLDILRLLQLLTPRVQAAKARMPTGNADNEECMQQCLQRFHLVRCSSSYEYLLALASLDSFLAAHKGRCKLVLLDNINAFLSADRAIKGSRSAAPLTLLRVHEGAAAILKNLAQKHRFAVLATKAAVVEQAGQGDDGNKALRQRESLPHAWLDTVRGRLLLWASDDGHTPFPRLAEWQDS